MVRATSRDSVGVACQRLFIPIRHSSRATRMRTKALIMEATHSQYEISRISRPEVHRMRRPRHYLSSLMVLTFLLGFLEFGQGPPAQAQESPPGKIWVVNANVREHRPRDSRRHGDMREFV